LDEGVARPHLDLRFYNYGTLYFYAWQGAVEINNRYGIVKRDPTGSQTPAPDSPGAMILVGRIVTALLGAFTVLPIFALGKRLFHRNTGLVAAAIYAIMPAAVVHAHFATVD